MNTQTWSRSNGMADSTINYSWSTLEYRLENLHQESGESMYEYTQRTMALYNDHLSMYGDDVNNFIRQKTTRDIARYFIENISNRSVRDAMFFHRFDYGMASIIKLALEKDKLQRIKEPKMIIICEFCSRRGHRREKCLIRMQMRDEINVFPIQSTLASQNPHKQETK